MRSADGRRALGLSAPGRILRPRGRAASLRGHHRLPVPAPLGNPSGRPARPLRLRGLGPPRDPGGACTGGCEVYAFTREAPHRELATRDGRRLGRRHVRRSRGPLDAAVTFAPAGDVVPAALSRIDRGGVVAVNAIHMDPLPPIPYETLYGERSLRSVMNFTRRDAEEFLALAARDSRARRDGDASRSSRRARRSSASSAERSGAPPCSRSDPRRARRRLPLQSAKTFSAGVIVTASGEIPSLRAPMTLSSSSSSCGFSPSYLIGENASETSLSRSPCASFVMMTICEVLGRQVLADRAVDVLARELRQPLAHGRGEVADAVPLRVERVADLLVLRRRHDVDVLHQVVAGRSKSSSESPFVTSLSSSARAMRSAMCALSGTTGRIQISKICALPRDVRVGEELEHPARERLDVGVVAVVHPARPRGCAGRGATATPGARRARCGRPRARRSPARSGSRAIGWPSEMAVARVSFSMISTSMPDGFVADDARGLRRAPGPSGSRERSAFRRASSSRRRVARDADRQGRSRVRRPDEVLHVLEGDRLDAGDRAEHRVAVGRAGEEVRLEPLLAELLLVVRRAGPRPGRSSARPSAAGSPPGGIRDPAAAAGRCRGRPSSCRDGSTP